LFPERFLPRAFSFCLTVGLHSGAEASVSSAAPSVTSIPAGAPPIAAASDAFVPEKEPPLNGQAPEFVAAAGNVHHRLVFGPDDLPQLKAIYASERGRVFREAMEKYLPSCIPPMNTEFRKVNQSWRSSLPIINRVARQKQHEAHPVNKKRTMDEA